MQTRRFGLLILICPRFLRQYMADKLDHSIQYVVYLSCKKQTEFKPSRGLNQELDHLTVAVKCIR